MAGFRYLIENIATGQFSLLDLDNVVYEEYLLTGGPCHATIPLTRADDNAGLLEPGARALYIQLPNGKIDWGGLLIEATVPEGAMHVELLFEHWLQYLDRRDIWTDREFPATEQFDIFKTLVDDAQDPTAVIDPDGTLAGVGGDVGFEVVWDTPSGVLRDRLEEYRYFKGKNLGQALRELAMVENGFDYTVRYTVGDESIAKQIKLFHPQMGFDHSGEIGFVYERGKTRNVRSRGLKRTVDQMSWRVRGWGAGADESRMRSDVINETQRGVYPFFDGQAQFSSVVEQATLDENTAAFAASDDHPHVLPSITVDPNQSPEWATYGVGDIFNVTFIDGYASLDGPYRIVGRKMFPAVDTGTLYLAEVI